MAKEGLFNVMNNLIEFDGLNVLDLFCGTGNVSFEFASRGAGTVTCVDQNPRCAAFIRSTFDALSYDGAVIIKADALRFVSSAKTKWDLIFADPPYESPCHLELVTSVLEKGLLTENGLLVLEHPGEIDLSSVPGFTQIRKYGRVHFSFFELKA